MDLSHLVQPDGESVGDRLISELESGKWDEFHAIVAFAKMSGVGYLDGPLRGARWYRPGTRPDPPQHGGDSRLHKRARLRRDDGGDEMAKPAPSAASEAPLLLERERELDVLRGALERLLEGVGSMVLVEGPAGIGKTRLLAEAAGFARQREFTMRSARGGQLEREMPFGIARQLFEPVIERASDQEWDRLFAGSAELALSALGREDPARAGSAGDPFAPIHGLYWLLANLAEERPVALIIDDAHWADAQTLRFLDYLARRLQDTPVVVVAGVRSGEPDEPPEIEPLRLEAELVQPGPLSGHAVRELIAAELEAQPAPEFSAVCAQATAGNPFLLAEVLRTIRADAIEPDPQAAAAIAELGPESVARYVLIRLARFGDDAVALARAIAVLSGSPQIRHAAKLAALDEDRARGLCDRLREAEILSTGMPIAFVHPLVRAAIYQDLSEEARSVAHRRAAELLSESGSAVREAAAHLIACSANGDQWVVARLEEAAKEALASGAPDSAQAYLERALREPPEDEVPILYRLGRALMETEPTRAPELLDEVVERATHPGARLRALRWTAVAYMTNGNAGAAVDRLSSLLKEIGTLDREIALALEAQIHVLKSGSTGRDRASSQRIRAVRADLTGKTPGECLLRQAAAFDCAHEGTADEVADLLDPFTPPEWGIRTPVPAVGCKLLAWSGRWDRARAAAEGHVEAARQSGSLITVAYHLQFLADVERLAGRLPDAEAAARTALEIADEVAPRSLPWWGATTGLVAVLVARGAVDDATRLAEGVDLSAGLGEVDMIPWPLEVRASLRLARGELEGGAGDLLALGEVAETWSYVNPAVPPWRQDLVPALVLLDRTAEAAEIVMVGEERARAFGAPYLIGVMLRSRAVIEPRKRQIETLRESVTCLEQYGPPHELARSLLELGAAQRRDGQRSESREPLRRALELAVRCGAGGLEARAREELAVAGSRPRSAFRTGVASLTASELRTAKLAAEGLSNVEIAQRLFVTRKTVEKHLSNAYMKLDISGREELSIALEDSTA